MARQAQVTRNTNETQIRIALNLDGTGQATLNTGIGFFDHMLDQIARHGLIDLEVEAVGDLHIDDHHTVEDTGITLGMAVAKAIGDKKGIRRYGHAYVPLDEALSRVVIDFSGRPGLEWHVPFTRATIGKFDVDLRVVSVREKRQSYGASFSAEARSLRKVAHMFSDGMHKTMRGVDGIATSWIAFSSTRDGERMGRTVEERAAKEIYMMDYDGANQRRVTTHKSLDISPTWCPDGTCIAYQSYQSGFPDIIVQNIYGQIGFTRPTESPAARRRSTTGSARW